MAIDVSEILTDTDLTDRFSVLRRSETVGTNGRNVITAQQIDNVVGVVTMGSPSDMQRTSDYEMASRTLSIVTKFHLQTVVQNYQPDIVIWRGDNYIVAHTDLYPQFGEGFIQAECHSVDLNDMTSWETASDSGNMAFNNSKNACLISLGI